MIDTNNFPLINNFSCPNSRSHTEQARNKTTIRQLQLTFYFLPPGHGAGCRAVGGRSCRNVESGQRDLEHGEQSQLLMLQMLTLPPVHPHGHLQMNSIINCSVVVCCYSYVFPMIRQFQFGFTVYRENRSFRFALLTVQAKSNSTVPAGNRADIGRLHFLT